MHPRLALECWFVEHFGQGIFCAGDGVLRREGPDRFGKPLLPEGGHMDLEVSCRGVPWETPHTPAVHCSLTAVAGAVAKGQKKTILFCSCIVCMN